VDFNRRTSQVTSAYTGIRRRTARGKKKTPDFDKGFSYIVTKEQRHMPEHHKVNVVRIDEILPHPNADTLDTSHDSIYRYL
jgi:hypothetical protein